MFKGVFWISYLPWAEKLYGLYYSVGWICVGTVHVHGDKKKKNLMALEWDHPKFVTLWLEKVKLEENVKKKKVYL